MNGFEDFVFGAVWSVEKALLKRKVHQTLDKLAKFVFYRCRYGNKWVNLHKAQTLPVLSFHPSRPLLPLEFHSTPLETWRTTALKATMFE